VDETVCVMTPEPFFGVGQWYIDFSQTSDEEVIELLRAAALFGRREMTDGPGQAPGGAG
jgi:predicted phosphoribosyltransferase